MYGRGIHTSFTFWLRAAEVERFSSCSPCFAFMAASSSRPLGELMGVKELESSVGVPAREVSELMLSVLDCVVDWRVGS
jgi:hypothetical protein